MPKICENVKKWESSCLFKGTMIRRHLPSEADGALFPVAVAFAVCNPVGFSLVR